MADLKSFHASGVYGMAVATSIVSQNSLGVQDVYHLPVEVIESQLKVFLMTRYHMLLKQA